MENHKTSEENIKEKFCNLVPGRIIYIYFFFLMRTVGGDMKILEAKVLVVQPTKF